MEHQKVMELETATRNLLINCANAKPGEKVLLAYESAAFDYFGSDLMADVKTHMTKLGFEVDATEVGFEPTRTALPDDLLARLTNYDVIVFLSRLGDQLRFSEMPKGPKFVVCFALNSAMFGSAFGAADYRVFVDLKKRVDQRLLATNQITITCPAGTHVTGTIDPETVVLEDTTSQRFPMSVFSPVPAALFSGRVALCGFLTGTGSQYYEDYTVTFEDQLFALLEKGRLTGFEGSDADVCKANAQYDRVAELFDIDRNFVHSWHAGIHPGCGFPWDMHAEFDRWGGSAFGNPRILHFHTCGAYAPGEVSWNLFDPTIDADGVRLWENGRFYPDRLDGGADIVRRCAIAQSVFDTPDRRIGLSS